MKNEFNIYDARLTKFCYRDRVRVNVGFLKGLVGEISGTRKYLWFEREYAVRIADSVFWIKEMHLTIPGVE